MAPHLTTCNCKVLFRTLHTGGGNSEASTIIKQISISVFINRFERPFEQKAECMAYCPTMLLLEVKSPPCLLNVDVMHFSVVHRCSNCYQLHQSPSCQSDVVLASKWCSMTRNTPKLPSIWRDMAKLRRRLPLNSILWTMNENLREYISTPVAIPIKLILLIIQ